MNKYFSEVKKNFGFGMMRLPRDGAEEGYKEICEMVDAFMAGGFDYRRLLADVAKQFENL